MRANFERPIDGFADAAQAIDTNRYSSSPLVAISINCLGRRLVLEPSGYEEIDAALAGFPVGGRQIGFWSYGEIYPLVNGKSDLHNQTMTITLLSENT